MTEQAKDTVAAVPDDVTAVLSQWGDETDAPMNGESGRALTEAVVRVVQSLPDVKTVCDLGCGNGFLAAQLGPLGYQVLGIDGSHRLIRLADQHHRLQGVTFRHGLFGPELAEELGAGRYDLVVSVDVIEHLYRPRTLVETAARILKPGGRLVLCTPYHGYVKNLAISLSGTWDAHHGPNWDGGHVKFFSVPTLRAAVRSEFEVERFEYFGRWLWLWKNMICVARKKPAR